MVEISNNLLAGLLVVAIVISGSGLLVIAGMGPVTLTGGYFRYGTANVTITGQLVIEMIRNVTNFGSSTIGGQMRIISTQQENNWTGGGTFRNGTEGNGTDYGPGTLAFPFVLKNEGNVNASINISTTTEASSWIGGVSGAGAYFKAKNNNSGDCAADLGSGHGEGSWTALNVSETVACSDLYFENDPKDELRLHFRLQMPDDAVGTKGTVVNIGAITS